MAKLWKKTHKPLMSLQLQSRNKCMWWSLPAFWNKSNRPVIAMACKCDISGRILRRPWLSTVGNAMHEKNVQGIWRAVVWLPLVYKKIWSVTKILKFLNYANRILFKRSEITLAKHSNHSHFSYLYVKFVIYSLYIYIHLYIYIQRKKVWLMRTDFC